MVDLNDIVNYCDARLRVAEIIDFKNALNGLQVENNKKVTRLGAAVDASLATFKQAVAKEIDFLLVHHGLFWNNLLPITDDSYKKLKILLDNNIALYSVHLPLDIHPELGNNARILELLGLTLEEPFPLNFEGQAIGLIASGVSQRSVLRERLAKHFPKTLQGIEKGPERIERIAILSGSGTDACTLMREKGVDTLITGELKQHCFCIAEEQELNLYPVGHYATETFGVQALLEELKNQFNLEIHFLASDCPL